MEKEEKVLKNLSKADSNMSILPQKLSHNGEWKESDEELANVTSRILVSLNIAEKYYLLLIFKN